MRERTFFEQAIKAHGLYAVAVRMLSEFLGLVSLDGNGETFDIESVERRLAVLIGHIRVMGCPECNRRTGLLPVESDCLSAIGKYEGSKNRGLLDDVTVQVFIADGRDYEMVSDPLAVYAHYLRGKMLQAAQAQVAQAGGETSLFLLN